MAMPVMVGVAAMLVVMVGPAHGTKRPLDDLDRGAEPDEHVDEHVIVGDVDRLARDLGRHVPVADMPGEREEVERIIGADLDKALGRSLHLDEPAALQPDGIAVLAAHRPGRGRAGRPFRHRR